MITQVITIYGTVQGVGFRPTTVRLAKEFGIKGCIRNMGGFVQLIVTDEPERIDEFIDLLQKNKPHSSEILKINRITIETTIFDDFSILPSVRSGDEIAMIPADIAICDKCLAEFNDKENYRYLHPYISCTDCGPRYTIMERLPYDRATTTMEKYPFCDICNEEYNNPDTRRYHAQTVSCHNCGPVPLWKSNIDDASLLDGYRLSNILKDEAIGKAVVAIKKGKVIALKGIGGYYFVCSAKKADPVMKIREIKKREEKPFAILFKDIRSIQTYCKVNEKEEELLTSLKRPIVLLEKSYEFAYSLFKFALEAQGHSRYIGAFLPSFGLQYILLEFCGPLIMTSANISSLPIIKDDEEMFDLMQKEEDLAGILYNDREIVVSTDDSVCRVIDDKPQLIRRSKGYTPTSILLKGAANLSKDYQIFATGGHLKSSFSISKGSYAYPSKFFGDLDNIENEEQYLSELERMKEFFNIKPSLTVCDSHPNYATTKIAVDYPSTKLLKVQHHHAHIASVMAEHGLVEPVIGIAFDGTGYGDDGCIWGGEVLICEGSKYERFSHLAYTKMIGGDSSMKEAWKSAISHKKSSSELSFSSFQINISDIIEYSEREQIVESYCDSLGHDVYRLTERAIEHDINVIESSSIGRLFDAVASLLGIKHENGYEGECAVMLENAAYSASNKYYRDEVGHLALTFHKRVANAILRQCLKVKERKGLNKVALSGGVFHNKVLMNETLKILRENGFEVFYNTIVPPNDGGIALGQNYIGMLSILNK